MESVVTTGFLEEVNQKADAQLLLQRIGYATDKAQVVGESIKTFCPIHRDTRFRSLLVDTKKQTFKCTIKTCPGYAGGSLVELYAMARRLDTLSAAQELVGALDLEVDSSWNEKLAASLFDEAERAFVRHDHEAAEPAARQALQFQPNLAEARLLLANLYTERGETERACEEFFTVAETYLGAEAFSDADCILERAYAMFPANEDLLFLKVHSAELQGHNEQVIALLYEIASQRDKTGRSRDNFGVYERLLELQPDDPTLHIRLADLHEAQRDIRHANREREKAVNMLIEQQKREQAIPLLEKILHFEPELTHLRVKLAEQLVADGEYMKAKEHFLEVINAQVEQCNFVGAAQSARKWLEIEPESTEIHEALARIYQEQGQTQEAMSELRQAAEIAFQQKHVEQSLELLFRVKFVQTEDMELRNLIVERLKGCAQSARAAFELLDIAEVQFAHDNKQAGEQAMRDAIALGEQAEFKLQVAEAARSHDCLELAREIYVEALHSAEEQENWRAAIACNEELRAMDPDNLELAAGHCRLLWKHTPRAALPLTTELVSRLIQAEDKDGAAELLQCVAESAGVPTQTHQQLFELSLQMGHVPLAERFYSACRSDLLAGDPNALLEMGAKLLPYSQENEQLLLDQAESHAHAGNADEAVNLYGQLAQLAQRQGRLAQALRYLDEALLARGEHPELLKRKAELLLALQDPVQARQVQLEYLHSLRATAEPQALAAEYEQYLQINPGDDETRQEFAEFLAGQRQYQQAAEHYHILLDEAESLGVDEKTLAFRERLLTLEPDNADLHHDLAIIYRDMRRTEDALGLLLRCLELFLEASNLSQAAIAAREALELSPENTLVLEKLVSIERTRQNPQAVEECVEKLIALGRLGAAVEWFSDCAAAALRDNRAKEAEDYAIRWKNVAPDDPEALGQLAAAYVRQQRTQRAVECFVEQSNLLRARGDFPMAASALRQALEIESENIAARQLLWQNLLDAGREEEALEEMQQLADLLIERRCYKDATTLLSRILEYRTNSVSTLQRLASLVHEYEGFSKALPYFRKLLSLRRQSLASPAEVIQDYETVLRLEGADVELRIEYAEYLDSVGEKSAAKDQLLHIAQTFRDELNDPVRAIQFFGRATTIAPGPDNARVFEELASLHLALNVPDFAVEAMREAIRHYEMQGALDKTLVLYKRLVEMPGDHFGDYVRMGDLLAQSSRRTEAIGAYRRALDLSDSSVSCTVRSRRSMCQRLLELDPLDFRCALMLIEILSPQEVIERVIIFAHRFKEAGMPEEQMRLLERGKQLVPSDLNMRRELLGILRRSCDVERIREELIDFCRAAAENHQPEAAREALNELNSLPPLPDALQRLAPLYALCGDTEQAVACYCDMAEKQAQEGQLVQAAETLRQAMAIDAPSVQPALLASLVRHSQGQGEISEIALDFLDSSLRARSRTRALVIATALLEFSSDQEVRSVLKRIHERAGAAFAVAIGGAHADWLVNKQRTSDALAVVDHLTSLASGSPDAWWLAAQLHRKCGDKQFAASASLKAAKLYSEAGAVTEEEACYREALEEFPDDAAVLETLVFFYERERRVRDALAAIKRLTDLAISCGDNQSAKTWLGKALEIAPEDCATRETLIDQLLKSGDSPQAVEQLVTLANVYGKASLPEKAIAAYERVLGLDSSNEQAIAHLLELARQSNDTARASRYSLLLADSKAEQGKLKEACEILKTLHDSDPDNLRALEKLIGFAQRAQDAKTLSASLLSLAHKLAERGEYAMAIVHLELLLKQQPDNREVLQLLIDCSKAAQNNKKASEYAEQLLRLSRQSDDPQQMLQASEAILAIAPESASAHRDLGLAYQKLRKPAEAVTALMRAAELYQAEKDYPGAAECLRTITALAPDHPPAWKRYADLLVLQGDMETARNAYLSLSDACMLAGEPHNAEAAVTRAVQIDPDDTSVHEKALELYTLLRRKAPALAESLWLARQNLRQRNYTVAETLLQQASELDPENADVQQLRLEVLEKLGRSDELQFRLRELARQCMAREDYRQAAELLAKLCQRDPNLLDVRRELGALWLRLGEEARAFDEYRPVISALLQRSETEEARDISDKLLRSCPESISLRAQLAQLFAQHNCPDVAARHYLSCAALAQNASDASQHIKFLRLAVEIRPQWSEAVRQLADACLAAGANDEAAEAFATLEAILIDQKQLSEAIDILRRHIGLTPKDPQPRRRLIELYSQTGDRENRIAEMRDLADLLLSRGQIDDAVDNYRELASLRPDDTVLLQRYLELFAQIGNELEVVDDYLRLADSYANKGAFAEATKTFERLLTIDRRNTQLRERFIAFLLQYGQVAKAIGEMLQLAQHYHARGNSSAAAKLLSDAAAHTPQDFEMRVALAQAQLACGLRDDAYRAFMALAEQCAFDDPLQSADMLEQALKATPDDLATRIRFGEHLVRIGDHKRAGDNARAMAEIYSARGEIDKAEAAYQNASTHDPETLEELRRLIDHHAHDPALQYLDYARYGDRLSQMGQIDGAIQAYRRARSLNDDRPELIQKYIDLLTQVAPEHEAIGDYVRLAQRYQATGDRQKALVLFSHVLRLDAKNQAARAGLDQLGA